MTIFIDDLAMRGIVKHPNSLIFLSGLSRVSMGLQPGNYVIKPDMSLAQLFLLLSGHPAPSHAITLVEGWTFATLIQHLAADPYILHDIDYKNELALMTRLSGAQQSPEGEFLPQTYWVIPGSSEYELLERAYQAMQQQLQADWNNRESVLPLQNSLQALVLASLVEEESKKSAEMPMIASVFYNRLRCGMRLQSDPTILYAVNKPYGSHISRYNLKSPSAFNTYEHAGLPPTAIGLPGSAALWAVLHPDRSFYYYFEADGRGGLVFSKDLTEQDKAIKRYNPRKRS